jgi:hypothetical protein
MKPEVGINAGSVGLLMLGKENRELEALSHRESGLFVDGEIRSIIGLQSRGYRQILFAKNNDEPEILLPN